MSIFRDFGSNARTHAAPGTVAVVVAMIAGFLVIFMRMAPELLMNTSFFTVDAWQKPWTFLTYPYFSPQGGFLGLVFLCLWIWGIGGSVERELGTGRYLAAWFIFSALCGLGLWIGAAVFGVSSSLSGGWTPVAAVTVIWGTRNPAALVQLMFILPITGRWMAWLSTGLVFFGTQPPQMAPFAALPLALAYFFAANKLPLFTYGGGPRPSRGTGIGGTRRVYKQEYYDEVKRREASRAERERLRKLFEQSMVEDPDKKEE
jgi:membrane associated rhomboid family serine protease